MSSALEKQRIYYARRELGLCVRCGINLDKPGQYVNCAECREKVRNRRKDANLTEWRREYMREYRANTKDAVEKLALIVQKIKQPSDLTVRLKPIPEGHKCWNCVWARWHGDRFFCPLVGCVKGPTKQEVAIENENN